MTTIKIDDKIFIDPTTDIKPEDLPVLVFCENSRNLISWAIRIRTGGDKNHVMEMFSTVSVATQNFSGYQSQILASYLQVGEKLKFVSLSGAMTDEEKFSYFAAISKELKEPWWKRSYDFLGIVGQVTGLKFINNPWANFCSERVAQHCRLVKKLKPIIPYKPSPEELNEALKKIPEVRTLRYWIQD